MSTINRQQSISKIIMTNQAKIIAAGFALVMFANFAGPLYPISDFWWHIATGKWIAGHVALPTVDPFSQALQAVDHSRETVILQGYWGVQLLFYASYVLLGYFGVVLLKAAVFTALGLVAFTHVYRNTSSLGMAGLATLPVMVLSVNLVEARPQIFSFLAMSLILCLLSGHADRLLKGERDSLWMLLTVSLIMLLWANVHPGYILGVGIIGIYVVAELVEAGKEKFESVRLKYVFWLISAIVATFFSPTAVETWQTILGGGLLAAEQSSIAEYRNTVQYLAGESLLITIFWVSLALGCSLWMISHWRQYRVRTILVFVAFLAAGLMSYRYSFFFAVTAIPLITENRGEKWQGEKDKPWLLVAVCVAALLALLGNGSNNVLASLKEGAVRVSPVQEAIEVAEHTPLPRPVFLPYEWGGNFLWELYPQYQTFVDARALDLKRIEEYRQAKSGHPAPIFDKYGFNSVLFYLLSPGNVEIPDIFLWLMKQKDWSVVYYRGGDVIAFIKNSSENRRIIPKEIVLREVIAVLEKKRREKAAHPGVLASLGKVHFLAGNNREALECFKEASGLRSSLYYTEWVNYLEQKLVN